MLYISGLLSLMFFLGTSISIFWGIYIIRLNSKSNINITFLLSCIALSIWSFGFGMANLSSSLETAVIWRRFASIGMTSLYSLTLHFLILLTRQKDKIKHEGYLFLLHIPALVSMYIFTFSNEMAVIQYDLLKTNYGLSNIAPNSIWNYFYYTYYILYMSYGIFIVWRWKKSLQDPNIIRQARAILLAIVGSGLFSSLTDIVASTFLSEPNPQIAPLFILLPVWAMYYSARHYDLMSYQKTYSDELIITEREKDNIFANISILLIISAILNFILEYSIYLKNTGRSLRAGFLESMALFLTGIIIYFIQKIKNTRSKDTANISILLISIPVISLHFLQYSSITVWIFPAIIMIASLIFERKTLLVSTAIISIITQIVIWVLKPEQIVSIDRMDYIFRILIYLIAFIVSYQVNRIYISKLKENDRRVKFQEINAKLSAEFIDINKDNGDGKIDNFLSKLGDFFQVDRTCLLLIDPENKRLISSHHWMEDGIELHSNTSREIEEKVFYWLKNKGKQAVYIDDMGKLTQEDMKIGRYFEERGVKSVIFAPLEAEEKLKAYLAIESIEYYRKWTEEDKKFLDVFSSLLSDGLEKLAAEKDIQHMAYYDSLTGLANRFLFKERVEKSIESLEKAEDTINIVFIDLDNFKSVNDTIGHDGGDYLLGEIARSLKESLRESDTVARFAGDEFIIMLDNREDQKHIAKILDKIMNIFSRSFNIYGQDFSVTASAGISVYPDDGRDPESLIKHADTAMYEAKSQGKNTYTFWTTSMKEEIEMNMIISNDLYQALEREEFSLYYQPQIYLFP